MIDFIRDGFLFMKGGYIKVLNFLAMLGFFLIATGFLIIFYDSDFGDWASFFGYRNRVC